MTSRGRLRRHAVGSPAQPARWVACRHPVLAQFIRTGKTSIAELPAQGVHLEHRASPFWTAFLPLFAVVLFSPVPRSLLLLFCLSSAACCARRLCAGSVRCNLHTHDRLRRLLVHLFRSPRLCCGRTDEATQALGIRNTTASIGKRNRAGDCSSRRSGSLELLAQSSRPECFCFGTVPPLRAAASSCPLPLSSPSLVALPSLLLPLSLLSVLPHRLLLAL